MPLFPSRRIGKPPRRPRLRMLLVIAAIVLGNVLVGQGSASAASCDPPTPEQPGNGVINLIDPAQLDHGDPASLYGTYSYAGTVWYDWGSGSNIPGMCQGPGAWLQTNLGNWFFKIGKGTAAGANGLWYMLGSHDNPVAGLDKGVGHGAKVLYGAGFVPYLALALILGAVGMFWHAQRGKNHRVASKLVSALVGLGIAGLTIVAPSAFTNVLDRVVIDGSQSLQGSAAQAAQGGKNKVARRDAVPNMLYNQVAYRSWLEGEFGDAESSEAKKYGPKLLDAQAWKKTDVDNGKAQQQRQAKQHKYKSVAKKLKTSTRGYDVFSGEAQTRLGNGLMGAMRGVLFGLFPLLSSLGTLLVLWVMRLLVMGGSIIGLIMIVTDRSLSMFLRGIGKSIGHGFVLTLGSSLYYLASSLIANKVTTPLGQVLLLTVTMLVFFAVFRPIRNLYKIAGALVESAGFEDRGQSMRQFGLWRSYRRWRMDRKMNHLRDGANESLSNIADALRGNGERGETANAGAPSSRPEGNVDNAAGEPGSVRGFADRVWQQRSRSGTPVAALGTSGGGGGGPDAAGGGDGSTPGALGGGPHRPGTPPTGGGWTAFRLDRDAPGTAGARSDGDTSAGVGGGGPHPGGLDGASYRGEVGASPAPSLPGEEPSVGLPSRERPEQANDRNEDDPIVELHEDGHMFSPDQDAQDQPHQARTWRDEQGREIHDIRSQQTGDETDDTPAPGLWRPRPEADDEGGQ